MLSLGRLVVGCEKLFILGLGVRAVVEQDLRRVLAPVLGGEVQRGASVVRARVDVAAARDEQPRERVVPASGREVKRGEALGGGLSSDVSSGVEELQRDGLGTVGHRLVQRRHAPVPRIHRARIRTLRQQQLRGGQALGPGDRLVKRSVTGRSRRDVDLLGMCVEVRAYRGRIAHAHRRMQRRRILRTRERHAQPHDARVGRANERVLVAQTTRHKRDVTLEKKHS